MKTNPFLKAAAVALTIATISGIPASPFTANASAAITLDDKNHDEKAVQVLEASIEALGGHDVLSNITSMKQTGTISIPMAGISGTIELNTVSPSKFLLIVNFPAMGKTLQGLNDGVAWSSDAMNGPRILPENEAKEMIKQADLQASLNYREHYDVIEYVDTVQFDDQEAHKLRLVDTDGKESFEYYAVASGFQIGTEGENDSPMGKIVITTMLRDYKELGGMMQPTAMVQRMGPTEINFTFESADYAEIDDSVFALPDAIKALIEVTEAKEAEEKAAP